MRKKGAGASTIRRKRAIVAAHSPDECPDQEEMDEPPDDAVAPLFPGFGNPLMGFEPNREASPGGGDGDDAPKGEAGQKKGTCHGAAGGGRGVW